MSQDKNHEHNGSLHLVIPTYGARFYESSASKYPKILKKIQLFLHYFRTEIRLRKSVKSKIDAYSTSFDTGSIKFCSPAKWLYFYFTSLIYFKLTQHLKAIKSIPLQDLITTYKVREILSGDLIADTYIRFKPAAKINLKDKFIKDIIIRSHALHRLYSSILIKQKSQSISYYGCYSTYIQNGIPLRIASTIAKQCFTFGNPCKFTKKHQSSNLSNGYLTDMPNHWEYLMGSTDQDSEIIELAAKSLYHRIKGSYDRTMYYMNSSNKSGLENSVRERLKENRVLMLHDFFDASNVYRWKLYPDFYTWASHTIELCIKNNLDLFVKPHPNQIKEGQAVISQLQEKYKEANNILWIESEVPNHIIFNSCPSLCITLFGSVVAEAAYLGTPVLLAGDHPALNFDLGFTAKSLEEYESYLINPLTKYDPELRNRAAKFIAQHYKHILKNNLDPLISHFGLSFQDLERDSSLLKSKEVTEYIKTSLYECHKL